MTALSKAEKTSWVTTIIVVGFGSSVFFYYCNAVFLGLRFPFNTFLPAPPPFGDFFGAVDQWKQSEFKGVGFGLSYFPATYLIIEFFAALSGWLSRDASALVFVASTLAFVGAYSYFNLRSNSAPDNILRVAAITLMTYPMLFTLHTGNVEAIIFICLCVFVQLYKSGRVGISTIPLAFAISAKFIPAVFIVLFLADRRFKALAQLAVAIVGFSLLPLIIFDGGLRFGIRQYISNLTASQTMYFNLMVIGEAGNHFGHSLLNAIRVLAGPEFSPSGNFLRNYAITAILLFSFVSLFIIFFEKMLWRRVLLLVVCMCLLPYTSTDYKLIHFIIPLFLIINSTKSESQFAERVDRYCLILLAILMIPKSYAYLHGEPLYTLNGVANAAAMVLLTLLIIAARTYASLLMPDPQRVLSEDGRPRAP